MVEMVEVEVVVEAGVLIGPQLVLLPQLQLQLRKALCVRSVGEPMLDVHKSGIRAKVWRSRCD